MTTRLEQGDALLLVDVQNDFCPGGALPVPQGDEVVAELNDWIDEAERLGIPIFASQDWHPDGHISFAEQGGPWPQHCVQDTDGAAFRADLTLPESARVVHKGTDVGEDAYSAFQGTDLAAELADLGVSKVWVGGLALDYCVKASVLDAIESGFGVALIVEGTRAVNVQPGDGDEAIAEMVEAGAVVERGG
ncbi:MAG: nicotinamidase [Chloroflexi bacterium]|nr:nicotinamidase [Chloroflexota bacterium]MCY3936851.1 nicotinamidase [Chloroflexota bacterium]